MMIRTNRDECLFDSRRGTPTQSILESKAEKRIVPQLLALYGRASLPPRHSVHLSPFLQSTYLLSISLLFQRFRIKAFPQPFRRQGVQPAHRRRPPRPGRLSTPAIASEAGPGRRRASSCITSILSNEFYHGKEAAYIADKRVFDFTRLMCSRPFRLLLFIKETDSW